jgi:hypothetical protein
MTRVDRCDVKGGVHFVLISQKLATCCLGSLLSNIFLNWESQTLLACPAQMRYCLEISVRSNEGIRMLHMFSCRFADHKNSVSHIL